MTEFKVGDRVRLIKELNAFGSKVHDEGRVVEISPEGPRVRFEHSGDVWPLTEKHIELIERKE